MITNSADPYDPTGDDSKQARSKKDLKAEAT